jgi:hypothetical protein
VKTNRLLLVALLLLITAHRLPAPIVEQSPTPSATAAPIAKPKRTSRGSSTPAPERSAMPKPKPTVMVSAARAAPTDDLVFDRLDQWATDLQKQAMNWNSNCANFGRNHDSGGCQRALEELKAQFKHFGELAGEYHSNGTDCRATLRQRWIQYRSRQFAFDVEYAGVRNTARQSEEFVLNKEEHELREEFKKCTGK